MKSSNCMYALPHELTGVGDCCGMFRGAGCNNQGKDCIGYRPHTKESRQALKKAIEARKKQKGEVK